MTSMETDLALVNPVADAKRRAIPLFVMQALLLVALLLVWEYVLGPLIGVNWISRPSSIAAKLDEWLRSGTLFLHLRATLAAVGAGYALGAGAAIMLSFLIGSSSFADRVSRPFVTAGYSFPKEVIAPVFIILFGIGLGSKIALSAISVFFIVYQSAISGMRLVDSDLLNVMRISGAGPWKLFGLVVAPSAAPWIFTGLRVSVRYAFTGVIFGEMLSGNRGLGYLIKYAANLFEAEGVFAALLTVMVVSVALTLILQRAEKYVGRWRIQ